MKNKSLMLLAAMFSIAGETFAQGQAEVKETVAIIKNKLVESKEKLKKYEWLETTTTYVKGDQKSKKQNHCYYSVDGKLTKVETGGSTKDKSKGGLRGKIGANKKEDMADYIKKSIEKVQTYLPPDAEKVQKIYAAGKTTLHILEPNKKIKIDFMDYNQAGDALSVTVDKVRQIILAIDVNTYIDDPEDKVIFNIKYNTLPDKTQYAEMTTLQADAKKVKIDIENSGYKKAAPQM
ncbi:hypothetical protein A4H97_22645 [Niastella yeongjuensis]|uniref:Outer membrane lipoprotein carrier protein LolA n=1 Tax=Niastella yeongjuensis TaxID=354355 RepID=A0A1V9F7S1_9BACT|nr:hypothetical protein [Niastella yeongjuensis]OQP54287.1 hypothetical protein A4H97_22645 [Niastella yeongjuensis]SEP30814.1 hypothetical protein SAMN05660816_05182 [Niastella yeongjuensis]